LYMYFTGPDKVWNVFDFVIVTSSILDQTLSFWLAQSDGETFALNHLRVIRMMRVTRIVRGIRVMRVLRYVQPLRTLLRSIYTTLKSLVWTMILLALIFYGFGVAFTQSTSDYCREEAGALLQPGSGLSLSSVSPMCESPELKMYWSSLSSSMFTLFKAIAGGVSWHSVVLPLEPVGWFIIVLFVAFICFTSFAVLNVITGVFCQSAMESANLDNEIAVMQQLASREEHVESIKRLFNAIDQDASNDITIEEFEEKLDDARVIAYLDCMGIDCGDAWTLFKLIDVDMSGCIDIDEFVSGCLSLRGSAKAIHIAKMGYENKLTQKMLEESMGILQVHMTTFYEWMGLQLPEDELQKLAGRGFSRTGTFN